MHRTLDRDAVWTGANREGVELTDSELATAEDYVPPATIPRGNPT